MLRRAVARAAAVALLTALLGCGDGGVHANADDRVLLLAAASTQDALEEIARTLRERGGPDLVISPAGSNALAQQVIAGAPADLFLSANQAWAREVEQAGRAARVTPLLRNTLVLAVPAGNPAAVQQPADLLSDRVSRVAIAGEHVPVGIYAEQALTTAELYQPLAAARRIVRGHNARFTLAYVQRGEVDAGVLYATDTAAADDVEIVFTFDPTDHDAIVYPLVLLDRGEKRDAARQVYAFLQSTEAATIFRAHGFTPLRDEVESARSSPWTGG